jgi:aminotransferase
MAQDCTKRNLHSVRLSDRVNLISPSGIRKYFDLTAGMDGVISLGIGEPDFITPWPVREAAIYAIEKGYTMYTSNYGLPELRKELANWLRQRYGVSYDPAKELLITVGTSQALDITLRAILNPGDEVLMPQPSYVAYPACTMLAGGIPVTVPTSEANRFEMIPADVAGRITKHTRAVLVGYPSNPTGAVMRVEDLREIGRLAEKNDFFVIADEVYRELTYGSNPICFPAIPGMRDRTILIGGFSKTNAMTGWRVGYVAARPEIIEGLLKIHQYTMMCASIMGQMAALEALRSGEDDTARMVKEYDRRRRVIVKGLRDIGLSCFEPRGAFYAFPCIKSTGMTSDQFAEALLLEEKVVVVPGSAFGKSGEGYVRCCYATALPDIEQALTRMKRFLGKHRNNSRVN